MRPIPFPQEQRFQQHKVQQLLRTLLAERLTGQSYDPVHGSQLAKQLADDVRERVKGLGFSRHKLVVQARGGGGRRGTVWE